jgi:hypothetical protein
MEMAGMQCRLDDITTKVAPCAHGILIFEKPVGTDIIG